MSRLLLVRHGTHDEVGRVLSGRSQIALDARGRAEAAAVAQWLGDGPVAMVATSPRRRALETARPIAAAARAELVVDPALDEIDFGRFAGHSFAALDDDAEWRRWNAERDRARCPGGETMAEAVARFRTALRGLPDGAVVVTHCDLIRGLAAELRRLPYSALLAWPCAPGSVTELARSDGELRLVTLGAMPPA